MMQLMAVDYSSEIGEYFDEARPADEPVGVPELRLEDKLNILRTDDRLGWSSLSWEVFSDDEFSSSTITSAFSCTSTINLQSPAAADLGVIRAVDDAAEADNVLRRLVSLLLPRVVLSLLAGVRFSISDIKIKTSNSHHLSIRSLDNAVEITWLSILTRS